VVTHQFSEEDSKSNSESVKPDMIIDSNEPIEESFEGSEFNINEDIKKIQASRSLFLLRILSFIGMLFCFFFAVGILAYTAFLLLLSVLCLFRNQSINQTFYSFSKLFVNFFIFTLGLALAVLSPPLGFGFLIIYFTLKGGNKDRQFLKKNLNRFF
jgi:hypothetical protein